MLSAIAKWLYHLPGDIWEWCMVEGERMTFVKPDTRQRMVINCKCPDCGLTQLVGGPIEPTGSPYGNPDPYRRCEGCPTIINYHQHRVGDWEIVS
jgi:ribosomal protein S27E